MFSQALQNLTTTLLTINWQEVLSFLLLAAGVYTLLIGVKKLILKRLIKTSLAKKSEVLRFAAQLIISFHWPLYLPLSLVIAHQFISLPVKTGSFPRFILGSIFTFYLVKTINQFIELGLKRYAQKQQERKDQFDSTVISVIKHLLQILVWVIAAALLLQNFGLQIATILGGLGIAGIAVAFAVKDILEDIISYFTIFFDKPFRPGDYIVVGQDSGIVKNIGLKSTTLKTLRGEKVVISNKELTQSKIKNFSGMERRRDTIELTIDRSTPSKKLEKLAGIIEGIISNQSRAEFDRAYFKQIKTSGFLFSATYYIDSGKYDVFANTKKQINLEIIRKLEQEKIALAPPTQEALLQQAQKKS